MSFRQKTAAFLDRPVVRRSLLAIIIANAVLLGLETSEHIMAQGGGLIVALDTLCLAIFTLELGALIAAQRTHFLRNRCNLVYFSLLGVRFGPGAPG